MAWDMLKHVWPTGNICLADLYYGQVGFHFPYPGFSWVKPLPDPWLHWHFWLTGIAGLLLAAGVLYRTAAVVLFVGYTWYFLLDQTFYNNHYYLMSLLAFLSIWMPADKRLTLRGMSPRLRQGLETEIPFWPIFLLRAQFLIVYLYASVAKVNADWLTGEPIIATAAALFTTLESWLPMPEGLQVIHISLMLAWIGLAFDFLIGFLLMIPRTRLLAVGLLAIFHGLNHLLLPIGVFPFLAFTGSLIFLDPSWPDQVRGWLRSPKPVRPDWKWLSWGAVAVPGIGFLLGWRLPVDTSAHRQAAPLSWRVTALLCCWIAWQIVFPLRHFRIEGDASWTEEGQLFAWRMMLRQKGAGHITLHLEDPELVKSGEQERTHIRWDRAPESECRAVYIPVHGHHLRWEDHPGLNTVFEGISGYRTFYVVPNSEQFETAELARFWRERTGREVNPRPTISLEEALERITTALRESAKSGDDYASRDHAKSAEAIHRLAKTLPTKGDSREESLSEINDLLRHLIRLDSSGIVQRELMRTHPFSLAGAVADGPAKIFFVDACDTPSEMREVSTGLGVAESYPVWCDFTRLRPYHWWKLPAWFPSHEAGTLKIVWNYFHELQAFQAEALAVRPMMIQQYSHDVANRWEAESGRRPRIHAYTHVMMNYRFPRPLVDPTLDMASVDYSLWRHNEWILPLHSEKLRISERLRRNPVHQK